MTNFAKRHPNIASVVSVILFFVMMAVLSVLTGCKSSNHVVTVVTTDTLHVYHTDTLKVYHTDTICSVKQETVHDSIIERVKEIYYLDAEGNVVHSEKEKEKEAYHNAESDSKLIQHTVDSLVQAKVDSIYASKHEEEPVIVKVEKEMPWYRKVWNRIVNKFAYIGIAILIFLLIDRFGGRLIDWIKRRIE